MSQPTTTTAAPDLATLREQLQLAALAYPELRRGLGQALADIDRRLGAPPSETARQRHNRRRIEGLR